MYLSLEGSGGLFFIIQHLPRICHSCFTRLIINNVLLVCLQQAVRRFIAVSLSGTVDAHPTQT